MGARRFAAALVSILLMSACGPAEAPLQPPEPLTVSIQYPLEDTQLEMGRSLKTIIEVRDASGNRVPDATVTLGIYDPSGSLRANVPALVGGADVYRSEGWMIPHRSPAGDWELTAEASRPGAEGRTSAKFEVTNSLSEDLLKKFGFWVDEPRLNVTETSLAREVGDAQNGSVFWGGFRPQMHVLIETRLEVYWRAGDFGLNSPQRVRTFLLDEIGNLGFIPLRELGEFKPVRFKDWDGWQDTARGRLAQYDIQYMVFYAPEVDKTYVLGTMVVLPPAGIDAHATLRDGFEVHPEVQANGKADQPWPRLLPTPELVSPPLGTRTIGNATPIVVTWKPVKELAEDEYYKVKIDFDYAERNTSRYYETRATEFTLPADLYTTPNCGVFNWQVTLMRKTGVAADGAATGEPISYDSLHWYVEWMYPSTDEAPFQTHCQNPQT